VDAQAVGAHREVEKEPADASLFEGQLAVGVDAVLGDAVTGGRAVR
jgi:hypothetical protein